jgi:Tol biopolymer transport system component
MTVKTQQSKNEGYYLSKSPAKKINKILVELNQGELRSLILLDPADLSQKKIFETKSRLSLNPSITHNGEFIAIQVPAVSSNQKTPISQLSFIDINGKELDYISKYQRPFSLNNCAFSPEGNFLVYEFSLPNQTYPEIFVENDLKYFENAIITQEDIRIPNPEKAANHLPKVLPSGKGIVFLADYSGSSDICVFDIGLQVPTLIRLTNGAQAKATGKNIFAIDAKEEFLFYVQNAFWEEGEKVCAISMLPSGKPVKTGTISMTKFGQINYVEFSQNVVQISQLYNKITQLFLSPDGKDMIYSADGHIINMKLNGSKTTELGKGNYTQFSNDGKQVLIGLNDKNTSSISLVDFEVKRQDKKVDLEGQIESMIWF